MSKKVYKYSEDFGRHGDLEAVFVADPAVVERMLARGEVYLGEVLGKHSEVTATIDGETMKEVTADPAVIAFFEEHLGGSAGISIVGYFLDQEAGR